MKGWIIALIVILVVLFVGLPVLLVILAAVGVFKAFKTIGEEGQCFTNSKKWACGCSLMNKDDCKKEGGIHYKNYKECQVKCNTVCGKNACPNLSS